MSDLIELAAVPTLASGLSVVFSKIFERTVSKMPAAIANKLVENIASVSILIVLFEFY